MTRYSKTMSEALEEVKEASARADAKRAMSKDKDMKQNPFSKDDDATDDDVKAASKNIIMQLRKSVSMKGNHAVEFSDGKKKIDPKFAQAAMDKFMRIRKSDDKLKFQNKLAKSYKDLLKALKEQYEMVEEEFELELEEGMKMNDPKLLKMFDKLKKGSKIKLKTSSTISQGKDYVEYIVKSKNTVNKGRVEKITLATVGNEKAVKKFLYKRDGTVGFAIGVMGASIDDIKEEVELDEAKSATGYEIFHKDFSSAMQHATAFAKSKGQPIKKDEIDNKVATGPKKPSKGKENSYTLETEKGKRWSVQVYNMGNKFELNMYLTSSHVPEGDMLDEAKEPFAVVDTADGNKVVGTASDEKGAKSIITTSQLPPMKIKDKKTLKIVKVKKKQMIGQPIKEEEGPDNRPDSAKEVDQGRDDKKKTRIAQLQLQIAKATETINKLNAQEK